ncbi:Meiotically protein [Penicillium malachiteum]|uniref:Meiotically protein n=1 Tax=Penicillium malachiteum TaxID=1324776 RepID=UPI002548F74F|nr:Meiotically protein [Penicillium malachiteum]KAJ5736187.1 Meiotically protein [Penicillium malachiteum]
MTDSPTSICLVDNTIPSQPATSRDSSRRPSTHGHRSSLSKHISRASVSGQLAKRKYAKWQPDRLGVPTDSDASPSRESSRVRGSISAESSAGPHNERPDNTTEITRVDTVDFAPSQVQSHTNETLQSQPADSDANTKSMTELDILYENQRGSFFFGVPLYSHSSLLNFDPGAWMTHDNRVSPVNITNAQLPDPSWEWAWRTWYVDMSSDVDEQGWEYSFSFSSSQWHGTHPWFHSFAHMLTEDYFTIHSSKTKSREQSIAGLSKVESGFLSRATTTFNGETPLEEIADIPSLMHALKMASIDRERLDALKTFVQDGGEELYYLNDKIPEIMASFLFQASRWQLVTYLTIVIQKLTHTLEKSDNDDPDKLNRKKDNLIRAMENARQHVTGPDMFTDIHNGSAADLLDLTPVSRHDTLLSKRAQASDKPLQVIEQQEIKGIPKAAEIGREGHIY